MIDVASAPIRADLGYYRTMIRINIHEAKTHLSRYLPNLEAGETIVLCKRNVPIAEIRPIRPRRREPRETGFMSGRFDIPDAFFEPLPAAIAESFDGRSDARP
jgi:antitoxin (DNA-binding transcriptional repressor) of toxin-antitoxin stability system